MKFCGYFKMDIIPLILFLCFSGFHLVTGNHCSNGLYGTHCNKTCSMVINNCIACFEPATDSYSCSECSSGHYSLGVFCTVCSNGCNDVGSGQAKCNGTNGLCVNGCKLGWIGEKCDKCDSNYYTTGVVCQKCSIQCVNSCEQSNGTCIGGCRKGYRGYRCEDTCSFGCLDSDCDRFTGRCTLGCKTGFYGDTCSLRCGMCDCDRTSGSCLGGCVTGYFGQECDKICSTSCQSSSCEQLSGTCTFPCKAGSYGAYCNQTCNSNCLDDVCDRNTGVCSKGCRSGYFGEKCTAECSVNCGRGTCDRSTGVCDVECSMAYYGNYCNLTCSTSCPGTCERSNGFCSGDINCINEGCIHGPCNRVTGACEANCVVGFYGDYCNQTCTNCDSNGCIRSSGICRGSCKSGYYGDKCDSACSSACKVPTDGSAVCLKSNGQCTKGCLESWTGSTCDKRCSSQCANSICEQFSAACETCVASFYGEFCNMTCSNCARFSDGRQNCQQMTGQCLNGCNVGFYGSSCINACNPNCKNNNCISSVSNCVEGCIDGNYGDSCQYSCSGQCVGSTCGKTDGACTNGCTTGWYGSTCNLQCGSNCQNNLCDQINGACQSCNSGFYGSSCSLTCNTNCLNNLCQINGTCTNGCKSGFYGMMCDQACGTCSNCDRRYGCLGCPAGKYGSSCELDCSSNCKVSTAGQIVCDKDTGACECKAGFYGLPACAFTCNNSPNCIESTCDSASGACSGNCVDGFHGPKCLQSCPSQCLNQRCNRDTAVCFYGCKSGFYGNKCEYMCPDGCSECDVQSGTCSQCASNRYGTNCQFTCNSNCKVLAGSARICDLTTGACQDGCKDGWYGNTCSNRCSTNCQGSSCERISGYCIGNCKLGYYGSSCNSSCGNCEGGGLSTCEKLSGRCVGKCKAGFYGDLCRDVCSIVCLNRTCELTATGCTAGCQSGYYGTNCESRCNSFCRGECTRGTGECTSGCSSGFTGPFCDVRTGGTEEKDNLPLIVGVSVAGGLFVILVIVIVICCHWRSTSTKTKKRQMYTDFPVQNGWSFDDERLHKASEESVRSASLGMRYEKLSHLNYSMNGSINPAYHGFDEVQASGGTVPLEELQRYVARKIATGHAFTREHAKFPRDLTELYNAAITPENAKKNRFKNVYPYDKCRVVLDTENGLDGDYINASFIDGYNKPRSYIAAQGPTENVVNDFWRMVWQQRCENIVMLTNLVEYGVTKCRKYWPEEKQEEMYGRVHVKNNSMEEFADFTVSHFTLTKSNKALKVRHFQFTSWPDNEVPKYVTPIVEFNKKIRNYVTDSPTVVHCSAGIGRTGTYIALDYLLDQAATENAVNIFQCVLKMRSQRVNMVLSPMQYRFIHESLLEAVNIMDVTIRSEDFRTYFKSMMEYLRGSQMRKLEAQFTKIKTVQDLEGTEAANIPENKHKNRNMNIVAPDDSRVFLWSSIHGCNDYINAIYLPTYRKKYAYIITEMPQLNTLVDFCRLIHQEECRTIVMMNTHQSESEKYGQYWADTNQTVGCGPFQLKVTNSKSENHFTCRSIDFRYNVGDDKGSVDIKQYQCDFWPEGKNIPANPDGILAMMKSISRWQDDSGNHPIIVHCMNGAERSGLFCLVATCIDRIKTDNEISVPNTLSHMRARRQQLVPYFPQYKFCHEALQQYIDHAR